MRAALHGRQYLCIRDEPEWLARYRWALILDSLRGYDRDHPGAGPHPATTAWAAEYGHAIPGSSCAEQLAAVQRWDHEARRPPRPQHRLRRRTPSAIEQAIGAVQVLDQPPPAGHPAVQVDAHPQWGPRFPAQCIA
jgi:hypothetical protein